MGKLTSYLIGLTAAILISYYVLFTYYTPIINWLGPVIGSDIIFPFGFLFLLLGNPLSYPIVLLSWVVIGVLIGFGSRKGTKAIGAAIGVYFTIWTFLVLSVLSVAQKVSGISLTNLGGSTGTSISIPPLPPGTSISAILAEPIINSLTSIISYIPGLSAITGATGTGAISTSSILGTFTSFFYDVILPPLISNIVILMVVSGVTGTLIYRYFGKSRSPSQPGNGGGNGSRPKKTKVKKVKTTKVVRKALPLGIPTVILVFVAVAMMMLPGPVPASAASSAAPQAQSSVQASNSYLNSSMAAANQIFSLATLASNTTPSQPSNYLSLNYGGGYVGRYGNIYNIYAFLNSTSATPPSFFGSTSSSTTHPILSVVFASANLESIFNSLKQDGFVSASTVDSLQANQLYNIIPQALILEVYVGNTNATSSIAFQQASTLANNMGGTSPVNFLSLNLPVTNTTAISLYAYSLSISNLNSEASAVTSLSPYFYDDGMVPVMEANLQSGYLIPGASASSVDGSLFIAGHMDLSQLPGSIGNFTNFLNSNGTMTIGGNIYFMGGLFVKQAVIHSSASSHTITGDQVFNYNQNITFGSNQSIYAVTILYPGQNFTSSSPFSGYYMTVYSNVNNFSGIGNATNITFIYVPSGSSFAFVNISLPTNFTFPADIYVTQSVDHITGNTYKVTIIMRNNDTDTLNNVKITAASHLSSYGPYATIANGSTNATATSIIPGHSLAASFDVQLSGIGIYVVASPTFNYTINNSTFSILGSTLTANAVTPSVLHAFNQVEYVSFSTITNVLHINFFVQEISPGIYVFDLIILLIVLLDVYAEYRAFRRWNTNRKNVRPPQEPEGPIGETTEVKEPEPTEDHEE